MRLSNIITIAFLLLVSSGFLACDKEKECGFGNADFLAFGHFYGECVGEGCVEIFKIEISRLYEDTVDLYPNSNNFYQGNFDIQLPNQKYELVKDLESFIPAELWNETEVVIGQPDGGDWGGIYFEIKKGSTHQFWLLDQMDDNMPDTYNEFVDKINEKIALIHQ